MSIDAAMLGADTACTLAPLLHDATRHLSREERLSFWEFFVEALAAFMVADVGADNTKLVLDLAAIAIEHQPRTN
jgi:hypothetical protein